MRIHFALIFAVACYANGKHDCPQNAEWDECASACPRTCDSPRNGMVCILACKEGCACETGFVLDNSGNCVKEEDCPSKDVQSDE
mmetsp:Transcript_3366/g.4874  ORF Transcript_3366/g.4874 Transcript_3366/m.4874 type:complete len:85 (-) Transcript_3366:56-310(-)